MDQWNILYVQDIKLLKKNRIMETFQLLENSNFKFLKTTKVLEESTGSCFYDKFLAQWQCQQP